MLVIFLYIVVGVSLTRAAWHWNHLAGVAVGFLFLFGAAFKILGGLFNLVWSQLLLATHPGMRAKSKEFIAEWEGLFGEMRRGDGSTWPPPGLFKVWFKANRRTGVDARTWLGDPSRYWRP